MSVIAAPQSKCVLIIAYYFPPIGATGAMRPLNFCRHLPFYGWQPKIVATDPGSAVPAQPVDDLLLTKLSTGVDVLRVPHGNPLMRLLTVRDRLLRALKDKTIPPPMTNQERSHEFSADSNEAKSHSLAFMRLAADYLFTFPDPQCSWFRPVMRAIPAFLNHEQPQLVWATGPPWTSLLVGKHIAQRYNIPFVADFRDPWMGGYRFFSSRLLHRKAEIAERTVCAAAARVVLNTAELRARFCSVYPNWWHKFITITNGYAEEVPSFLPSHQTSGTLAENKPKQSALELSHFGTVYGNRNPIVLFRAIQELIMEGSVTSTQLRVRFVGAWDIEDQECNDLARNLEERGLLSRIPSVPHHLCLREMQRSDVLLILQQEYPMQVPAKIYEYIVMRRPLVVLGGEGATADLVRKNRLGQCCPNRVQNVKNLLASLLSGTNRLDVPDPAVIEQFNYNALSGKLAELFNSVVAARSC